MREHYYCEDSWYSCPKATDGCSQDNDGECTCGADDHNAEVLKVFANGMMELIDQAKDESLARWELDMLRGRELLPDWK